MSTAKRRSKRRNWMSDVMGEKNVSFTNS